MREEAEGMDGNFAVPAKQGEDTPGDWSGDEELIDCLCIS